LNSQAPATRSVLRTFTKSGHAKIHRGVSLISDALPFGRLWYDGSNAASNAIGYASQYSRSHDAVIRVYDDAGNVLETHEHTGDFQFRILLSFQFSPFGSKCSRSMRRAS
jgi:hypothetical protein